MLELRRLRYFLAVADARNFTRAAEELHIAQPALSRQVRLLEDELGVELIVRTTHTFELTDAGCDLHEHGPKLLAAAEALERRMHAFGAGDAGRVVIAYGTSAGYETAPRLLRAIAERLPDMHMTSLVMSLDEVVAGLRSEAIDIGLVRCPPDLEGIESRLLRLEQQGVLLRADDELADRSGVALDELGDRPVLLHARDENPGHYDAVLELFRARGLDPRIELRQVSFDIGQTPVAEGRAIAVVSDSAQHSLPAELCWVPIEPVARLEVRLLVRALGGAPATKRFLAAAEEVADEFGWRAGA